MAKTKNQRSNSLAAAHCIPELWTGLLLAGGDSSRMGRSKSKILLSSNCSQTFSDHARRLLRKTCMEYFILGGEPIPGERHHLADPQPPHGPFHAIVSALAQVSTEWALILPVDMPGLSEDFLKAFQRQAASQKLACVTKGPNRRAGFPVALPQSCFRAMHEAIHAGESSLFRFLTWSGVVSWTPPDELSSGLQNLNTPAELKTWRSTSIIKPTI